MGYAKTTKDHSPIPYRNRREVRREFDRRTEGTWEAGTVPEGITLERSYTYLIRERKSELSFALFVRALNEGFKGLFITRSYPEHIKKRYDLGDTPILWLSNVNMDCTLRPKDLEELSMKLDKFLLSAEKGVILLDGIEYLITSNDFSMVLKFVQGLRDEVTLKNALLLIPVSPNTLEPHKLKQLEEEADVVI
jgi:hypothetical protein